MHLYKLDGTRPTPVTDPTEWERWYDDADRVVAEVIIEEICASTVFVGIDYAFGTDHKPVVFETMVFQFTESPADVLCLQHYGTWEDAAEGHRRMVSEIAGIYDQSSAEADDAIRRLNRQEG